MTAIEFRRWLETTDPKEKEAIKLNGISNAYNRIADLMKRQRDEALNWHYEEVKMLQLKFNGQRTEKSHAEVHREPAFGFSRTQRVTVRAKIDFDNCDFPEEEFSLYEDDKPFGELNAWRMDKDREMVAYGSAVECFMNGTITE